MLARQWLEGVPGSKSKLLYLSSHAHASHAHAANVPHAWITGGQVARCLVAAVVWTTCWESEERGRTTTHGLRLKCKLNSCFVVDFVPLHTIFTKIARQLGTHPGTIPLSSHILMRWKKLWGLLNLTPLQLLKITLIWLAGSTINIHQLHKKLQLDAMGEEKCYCMNIEYRTHHY